MNNQRRSFLKWTLVSLPVLALLKGQNLFAKDVLATEGEKFNYKSKGGGDKACSKCIHYGPFLSPPKPERVVGGCKASECRLFPGKLVCGEGSCQLFAPKT
jgi:hypothetical protein